jgi:hypothetical protein
MKDRDLFWLAVALMVGHLSGWLYPRCLDSIVSGVTTRARIWTND